MEPGGWVKALLLGQGSVPLSPEPVPEVPQAEAESPVNQGHAEPAHASDGAVEAAADGGAAGSGAEVEGSSAVVLKKGPREDNWQKLSYAKRSLTDSEMMAIPFLKDSYAYQEVDFSQNGLTSQALPGLLQVCLKCSNLKVLKLYRNRIGDDSIGQLTELLARCTSLREVHLSHNRLTAAGITALVKAVAERRSDGQQPLWLRVENNDVQDSSALLRELEREMRVCPRRPECSQFTCCVNSKVHLPFLDVPREWRQRDDSSLRLRSRSPPRVRLVLAARAPSPQREHQRSSPEAPRQEQWRRSPSPHGWHPPERRDRSPAARQAEPERAPASPRYSRGAAMRRLPPPPPPPPSHPDPLALDGRGGSRDWDPGDVHASRGSALPRLQRPAADSRSPPPLRRERPDEDGHRAGRRRADAAAAGRGGAAAEAAARAARHDPFRRRHRREAEHAHRSGRHASAARERSRSRHAGRRREHRERRGEEREKEKERPRAAKHAKAPAASSRRVLVVDHRSSRQVLTVDQPSSAHEGSLSATNGAMPPGVWSVLAPPRDRPASPAPAQPEPPPQAHRKERRPAQEASPSPVRRRRRKEGRHRSGGRRRRRSEESRPAAAAAPPAPARGSGGGGGAGVPAADIDDFRARLARLLGKA